MAETDPKKEIRQLANVKGGLHVLIPCEGGNDLDLLIMDPEKFFDELARLFYKWLK